MIAAGSPQEEVRLLKEKTALYSVIPPAPWNLSGKGINRDDPSHSHQLPVKEVDGHEDILSISTGSLWLINLEEESSYGPDVTVDYAWLRKWAYALWDKKRLIQWQAVKMSHRKFRENFEAKY